MMERDDARGARIAPPPRSAEEALACARQHGLAALAESVLALRALLDAASLAATGAPSDAHASVSGASAWLDQIAEQMQAGAEHRGAPWLDAVARALDAEIERWETRGGDDPEARAVLRAFLGVREILWEFGLRPDRSERTEPEPREPSRHAGAPPAATSYDEAPSDSLRARAQRPPRRAPPARVERVPVKG
ncbi:MAG: hypothetical protein H6Q91_3020 [Deltaproteobacteria bacterium]|nr:hypothetical protein [Deltaproteobacteria bacterium]